MPAMEEYSNSGMELTKDGRLVIYEPKSKKVSREFFAKTDLAAMNQLLRELGISQDTKVSSISIQGKIYYLCPKVTKIQDLSSEKKGFLGL